ncbi:hypothetical protein KIH27_11675 [Mycobacterium sp. M1]|uniref:Uncharacterized protein n=1 Tax=Mycolicibacter acidiphilus TaxID=2835306 RepID=A0ABS5RL80_9MYCO|nr:hypothetical protein [Mycolicibacter acidiphilus]
MLDPASTSELASIPAGVDRVVIAADDPSEPLYPMTRGSAVIAEVGGIRQNLGIVVAVDNDRHWLVVDLIKPFLAAHRAQLRTTA